MEERSSQGICIAILVLRNIMCILILYESTIITVREGKIHDHTSSNLAQVFYGFSCHVFHKACQAKTSSEEGWIKVSDCVSNGASILLIGL
jgi:hypothetical protein